MQTWIRFLAFSFSFFLFSEALHATHNRAGEISVRQVNCPSLELEAIIVTYTKTSSPVDRDSIDICWGDGMCMKLARVNGTAGGPGGLPTGELIGNGVRKNVYRGNHIYPGRGTYRIYMFDPNRNGGILNINPPNSDNIQFFLQTTYTFLNAQFDGCNNTPILLQPPIDDGCIGQPFTHNPGAFDEEGDSLSYQLVVPLQDDGVNVPNYTYPQFVNGNIGSVLTLNATTGDLRWANPERIGEYNISFIIVSWRNGIPIDTVLRDMQITINECQDNQAPTLEVIDEICVVAGQKIEISLLANDPDVDDQVRITALGGPYEVNFPAEPLSNSGYGPTPKSSVFTWQTRCEHIALNPYVVVFKAEDDSDGSSGLATLKSVRIRVVGPPPEPVTAQAGSGLIEVSWGLPYACEDAEEDYFYGFSVWRRVGSNPFPPDTCRPGLAGRGYTRVVVLTRRVQNGRYYYLDENVERGRTYCYRILGRFARYSNLNPPQPFNIVESLPSAEICVQLSRDVPLMTRASVIATDPTNGSMEVRWTQPQAVDLDTIQNPGPYRYQLLRAPGINGTNFQPVLGANFTAPSFAEAVDTSYFDNDGLSTSTTGYNYKIDFYVEGDRLLGTATDASSVFLTIQPRDEANELSWDFDVPWDNTRYTIFRQNATGNVDSIGTTTATTYRDEGLVNGREYCYFVRCFGTYGLAAIPNLLVNESQDVCQRPQDLEAPCAPVLAVKNLCTTGENCQDAALENTLIWNHPKDFCEDSDDVIGYRLYYAPTEGDALVLLEETANPDALSFIHQPEQGIAGCYVVTAIDSFFNESPQSNKVCVDNCPNYELPNAFTPNGDNANDLFTPYPYCFIQAVDFQVFNRWGGLVFQATDPQLNWNGKDMNGNDVPEGTYFYKCSVFEQRVSGIVPASAVLSGYVDLFR